MSERCQFHRALCLLAQLHARRSLCYLRNEAIQECAHCFHCDEPEMKRPEREWWELTPKGEWRRL